MEKRNTTNKKPAEGQVASPTDPQELESPPAISLEDAALQIDELLAANAPEQEDAEGTDLKSEGLEPEVEETMVEIDVDGETKTVPLSALQDAWLKSGQPCQHGMSGRYKGRYPRETLFSVSGKRWRSRPSTSISFSNGSNPWKQMLSARSTNDRQQYNPESH